MSDQSKQIDFQRHRGIVDHDILKHSSITCIGIGGAASLCRNLARMGIGEINVIDHDHVSATNPATQAYGMHQVGELKAKALRDDIIKINPECMITAVIGKVQHLDQNVRDQVFSADLMLAMTDDFEVQAYLNRIACIYNTDTLFAASYLNAAAVEVTGTLNASRKCGYGCHRCFTYTRYLAYANGHQNAVSPGSHVFQAEYLNAILGNLSVAILHDQQGSLLGNTSLARLFTREPLIISRLDPEFSADSGEAFADTPPANRIFTTRHWHRNVPDDYICADCGVTSVPNQGTSTRPKTGERA